MLIRRRLIAIAAETQKAAACEAPYALPGSKDNQAVGRALDKRCGATVTTSSWRPPGRTY